jgi:hypothetical protein
VRRFCVKDIDGAVYLIVADEVSWSADGLKFLVKGKGVIAFFARWVHWIETPQSEPGEHAT